MHHYSVHEAMAEAYGTVLLVDAGHAIRSSDVLLSDYRSIKSVCSGCGGIGSAERQAGHTGYFPRNGIPAAYKAAAESNPPAPVTVTTA